MTSLILQFNVFWVFLTFFVYMQINTIVQVLLYHVQTPSSLFPKVCFFHFPIRLTLTNILHNNVISFVNPNFFSFWLIYSYCSLFCNWNVYLIKIVFIFKVRVSHWVEFFFVFTINFNFVHLLCFFLFKCLTENLENLYQ